MRFPLAPLTLVLALGACNQYEGPPPHVNVAAAANLGRTLTALSASFKSRTGITVIPSLGATAQLSAQIANGGPFDVFLSADVEHVDSLVQSGVLIPESRVVYARGRLVVWTGSNPVPKDAPELVSAKVIGIAKPELAPYGAAAVESLHKLGLWDRVQSKVVYAASVAAAKQYVDTGNADAAFTALSLVTGEPGHYFPIDESLHAPIDQALGIVRLGAQQAHARQFVDFVLSREGKTILTQAGYGQP